MAWARDADAGAQAAPATNRWGLAGWKDFYRDEPADQVPKLTPA